MNNIEKNTQSKIINSSLINEILNKTDPMQSKRVQLRMHIAATIIEAMKAQKVTKMQLAKKCQKSPTLITKWLSGTQNFTLDSLSDLEFVLGIQLIAINPQNNDTKVLTIKSSYSNKNKEVALDLVAEPAAPYQ